MSESRCKDVMGNTLEVGQQVNILPRTDLLWIAKIVEVSDGGVMLSIDKNQKGVTPAKVRLILDVTLQANPAMPVFPNLVRIINPASDSVVKKIMESENNNPPTPLTM